MRGGARVPRPAKKGYRAGARRSPASPPSRGDDSAGAARTAAAAAAATAGALAGLVTAGGMGSDAARGMCG